MTIVAPKKPCAECPWRRDVAPGQFPAERFRALAGTSYDMSSRIFSCHKSSEEQPTACAGWVLRGATHNLALRLAFSRGEIEPHSVTDGGYPLYVDYREMAIANGVKRGDPVLRHCRSA